MGNLIQKPMKLKRIFIASVSTIAGLSLSPMIATATAENLRLRPIPTITRTACSSPIVGQEPGSRVNMRLEPSTNSDIQSYVLVGQYVTYLYSSAHYDVLYHSRDAQDNTWYFVEYEPTQTRGWIREDFLGRADCSV